MAKASKVKSKSRVLSGNAFDALSAKQKEAIFAECERIDPLRRGKPLTPAQQVRHRRARCRIGRPVVGEGAEKVRVSLERGLLRETDAFARREEVSRSQVIAMALRRLMAEAA